MMVEYNFISILSFFIFIKKKHSCRTRTHASLYLLKCGRHYHEKYDITQDMIATWLATDTYNNIKKNTSINMKKC